MGNHIKFWAVVGDSNTRKTSTIRALSGTGQRKDCWDLGLTHPTHITVKAYIETSAPQEQDSKPSPSEIVKRLNNASIKHEVTHLLIALRHKSKSSPNGLDYINHFINEANWECLGIALTGWGLQSSAIRNDYDQITTLIQPNDSTRLLAANSIASQVRSKWGIE